MNKKNSFSIVSKPTLEIEDSEGNIWYLSTLSLHEIYSFATWVQYYPMYEANIVAENLSENEGEKYKKEIFEQCKSNPIQIDSEEFTEILSNSKYIPRLLYESLKIKHPSIQFKEISKIFPVKSLESFDHYLETILGFFVADEENRPTKKKK